MFLYLLVYIPLFYNRCKNLYNFSVVKIRKILLIVIFLREKVMNKLLEKMADALVKVGENVSGAHYMIAKK